MIPYKWKTKPTPKNSVSIAQTNPKSHLQKMPSQKTKPFFTNFRFRSISRTPSAHAKQNNVTELSFCFLTGYTHRINLHPFRKRISRCQAQCGCCDSQQLRRKQELKQQTENPLNPLDVQSTGIHWPAKIEMQRVNWWCHGRCATEWRIWRPLKARPCKRHFVLQQRGDSLKLNTS